MVEVWDWIKRTPTAVFKSLLERLSKSWAVGVGSSPLAEVHVIIYVSEWCVTLVNNIVAAPLGTGQQQQPIQ